MSDLKLRRCSPAARGVWLDVLCAFHDSDDAYGLLRWPLKEIARTIGASLVHLRELVDKGVLRGSDSKFAEPLIYKPRSGRKEGDPVTLIAAQAGPLWYSKRLVKDEYVRSIRGESSRFGDGEGDAPKPKPKVAPKPPLSDGTTASSSSSPSGIPPNPPRGARVFHPRKAEDVASTTVPSRQAEETAAYLREQDEHRQQVEADRRERQRRREVA